MVYLSPGRDRAVCIAVSGGHRRLCRFYIYFTHILLLCDISIYIVFI